MPERPDESASSFRQELQEHYGISPEELYQRITDQPTAPKVTELGVNAIRQASQAYLDYIAATVTPRAFLSPCDAQFPRLHHREGVLG